MKKQGWILIGITAAFFCLLLGVFLGRNTNKAYIQIEDKQAVQTQATVSQTSAPSPQININTATAQQLQLLPGIGETLARRIIDYRETNGDFKSTEELMNVTGIGEKIFDSINDYITIN